MSQGETILLVQPDPGARTLIAFMLQKLGFTVLEARNGVEAVQCYEAAEGRIDVLFTEVLMARMNGHELAAILTAKDPGMRVLYVADADYARLARRAQKGLLFLIRPFTMRDMAEKLDELLAVASLKTFTAGR
jgi:two-component system cell cycle sensor histidine kinase/response regulator CckA